MTTFSRHVLAPQQERRADGAIRLEPGRHYPRYEIIIVIFLPPLAQHHSPSDATPLACSHLIRFIYPTLGDAICPLTDAAMDATRWSATWLDSLRRLVLALDACQRLSFRSPLAQLELRMACPLFAIGTNEIEPAAFAKDISIVATGDGQALSPIVPPDPRPVTSLSHRFRCTILWQFIYLYTKFVDIYICN